MRIVLLLGAFASIAAAQYVGSQTCRACHAAKFESQSKTGHARALALAPPGSPGHWAFGAGVKAITYVSEADPDSYIEHGLSYYPPTKSTAPTPGHADGADLRFRTFDSINTTLRCFRCHSTGPLKVEAGNSIQPSEPGLRCESCHGPGASHVKAKGARGTIRNPKQLNASQLNLFCGSCHRKPPEVGDEYDWSNPWNVRHEPTYLSQSACFRNSSGALSCLTCHDPHSVLNRVAADYDKRCSACHQNVRHRSALAAEACVECHMPQVPTSPQLSFTNHWIGIYKKDSNLAPARRNASALRALPVVAPLTGRFLPPGDPATLRPLFERILADREKELGPQDPKTARSAADLGLFLVSIGSHADAEKQLRRSVQIDRANSDPALAADREVLASLLADTGKPNEARELFQSAAEGPDPAISARCYSRLAILDPAHAESHLRKALAAEETASGKNHPRVAAILNDLALAVSQQDDPGAAEPLFLRAMAIERKAHGADSILSGMMQSNLGHLLQGTGQLDESERLQRAAVAIFEKKLEPDSRQLSKAYTNLADVLWTKGDKAPAANLFRAALSIDQSLFGPEHSEVAADLTNLGSLLKETGAATEADSVLRRALAIFAKTAGPNSQEANYVRKILQRH